MNDFFNNPEVKSQIPVAKQISAGGVAFRQLGSEVEIAIILAHPNRRWQLPKGRVDEGESIERAAVREVREETGINTAVVVPLETIEYWYVGNSRGIKTKFHKFVHFFLLKYLDGEVSDHDHEVAEARWVSVNDAIEMLAFKNEVEMVKKAAQLIEGIIN
jgi:8-oxo-dGTP pyrophosphatase MutT (NUDIX family)